MEHQHMWVCAYTKWSQAWHRLSTVQRSSGGQRLIWQHNQVNALEDGWCKFYCLFFIHRNVQFKKTTKTISCLGLLVLVCVCWVFHRSPGYGILSVGRVCGCLKATRSWCAAFASTTKGSSVALTMGTFYALTLTSLCTFIVRLFFFNSCCHVSVCSKIKVWDLQAALDPRAPASTLCLRTLVVSVYDFWPVKTLSYI